MTKQLIEWSQRTTKTNIERKSSWNGRISWDERTKQWASFSGRHTSKGWRNKAELLLQLTSHFIFNEHWGIPILWLVSCLPVNVLLSSSEQWLPCLMRRGSASGMGLPHRAVVVDGQATVGTLRPRTCLQISSFCCLMARISKPGLYVPLLRSRGLSCGVPNAVT